MSHTGRARRTAWSAYYPEITASRLQARVEPGLKEEATRVFEQLGLSTSEAITLFLRQVAMHRGLPFELRIPNEETKAAIREAFEEREKLQRYETADELFEDLGI